MHPAGVIIIQVLLALILSYVVYLIAIHSMKTQSLAVGYEQSAEKKMVPVVDGVLSSSETAKKSVNNTFNTTIPFLPNYLPITPSVNVSGGSQFSYSFWLYTSNPEAALGKTLFLKGDKHEYTYRKTQQVFMPVTGTYKEGDSVVDKSRVVMCPSFGFGKDNFEFVLTFNTFKNMHQKVRIQRRDTEDSTKRMNLISLFNNSWVHIAVTVQDNAPLNEFDRGIAVRFYINGTLYQMTQIPDILKQNRGNFYLFPDGPIQGCKIADLKYYNFALSDAQIKADANSRIELTRSADKSTSDKSGESSGSSKKYANTLYTTLHNELDIYNT